MWSPAPARLAADGLVDGRPVGTVRAEQHEGQLRQLALQHPERVDQPGQVLARLLGAQRQHVGTSVEAGQVHRGARWQRGRGAQRDDRHPLGPEQLPHLVRRVLRGHVDRRSPGDGALQDGAEVSDRARDLVGSLQEPAVVHRHDGGKRAGRDDVVGSVHDLAAGQLAVDPGPVEPSPRPQRSGGRVAQPADAGAQLGAERQHVRQDVRRLVEGGQAVEQAGDELPHPRLRTVERPDVDGDARSGHPPGPVRGFRVGGR